jgi:hypothetical protein
VVYASLGVFVFRGFVCRGFEGLGRIGFIWLIVSGGVGLKIFYKNRGTRDCVIYRGRERKRKVDFLSGVGLHKIRFWLEVLAF